MKKKQVKCAKEIQPDNGCFIQQPIYMRVKNKKDAFYAGYEEGKRITEELIKQDYDKQLRSLNIQQRELAIQISSNVGQTLQQINILLNPDYVKCL
jgi:hypothetical protein